MKRLISAAAVVVVLPALWIAGRLWELATRDDDDEKVRGRPK